MKNWTFITLAFLFLASSCVNKSHDNDKGMAVFANDKSFIKAHENPVPVSYEAKGKMIAFKTPDGKTASAYNLEKQDAKSTLIIIHEWWGLNDYVKMESDRYFSSLNNVNILALDMYDGKVATVAEDASKFMQSLSNERAESIVKGALNYIPKSMPVATLGWCFGGGSSLKSSILAGEKSKACVMFYGMPVMEADKLMPLKAPVLGLFADKDQWITPEVVQKFEDVMKATKKDIKVKEFNADHGFANPSSPKHAEEAAKDANEMALKFLKDKLK